MNFSYSNFDQPTRVESLGFGAVVTPNTMKKMSQIIIDSIHDYRVRVWAEKLIGYSSDDFSKAEEIFYFLVNHCRYVQDPVGLEMLKFPMVSLQQIEVGGCPALDCDDATILIGSLLMSVGIRYALRAVSFNEEYSHVYGLAYLNKKWTPIDFVLGKKGGEFGSEPPGVARIKDMIVE